jgi:polar amino acid transport system substrate-binding protein
VKRLARLLLVAAIIAAVLHSPAAAQPERISVITTEIEPFVERSGDRADGFYIEIWEDVARDLGVDYDVIWADSFAEMLDQLEAGEADVAVAPLAPTAEREARIDFTSAVISSGPQLGVHERTKSSVPIWRTLFGSGALRVLLYAFLGLVVLGHIIWLVERRDKDISDFHHTWPAGVLDGIWWAAVTVTTVGYGDMSPKSLRGRLVGVVAMLASLFLVGAFVSQITADLAESRDRISVSTLDELDGAPVGAVAGSSFETFLLGEGVNVRSFETQTEAFEAAAAGSIDFVVTNPFALEALGGRYDVEGVGSVLYEEFETFGLQQDSPWREPINQSLANLQVTGEVQAIIDRWVGD